MVNPELLEYVKKSLEAGQTNAQIVAVLLQQGWSSEDINEAITRALNLPVGQGVPVPPAIPAALPARRSKRLVNTLIDGAFLILVGFMLGFFWAIFAPQTFVSRLVLDTLSLIISLTYFIAFESIWQKTPAKFLTKTKVVMRDGSKPDFLHILGRSLSRLIPFEFLSFLAGNPIGWHDKLSKTLAVPDDYTPEQVKSIDYNAKQGGNRLALMLLILLLVIPVVGIIATGVFVNLNPAGNLIDARNTRRVTDINILDNAVQKYLLDNNDNAPANLSVLVPAYLGSLPMDPSTGEAYSYCRGTTMSSYGIGITLETGGIASKLATLMTTSNTTLPVGCTLAPALGGACGTSHYFCHYFGS